MQPIKIDVAGMTCCHCVKSATEALGAVLGVTGVELELEPGIATVWHEGADEEALLQALRDEDFEGTIQT